MGRSRQTATSWQSRGSSISFLPCMSFKLCHRVLGSCVYLCPLYLPSNDIVISYDTWNHQTLLSTPGRLGEANVRNIYNYRDLSKVINACRYQAVASILMKLRLYCQDGIRSQITMSFEVLFRCALFAAA